jgi:UDP-4-amino-4,6-dideoxy-N-acetyl-beta-L-altrosamine transaminase
MIQANRYIPYGTQWIDEDDVAAVVEVLRHGMLTQGPMVAAFEKALADRVSAKYCVAFCNGTAALHCAVSVLDIAPGMEGITSPITFVASANCLAYNRLIPVFADIDTRTYNITANSIRDVLGPKTKVLIPVHFAGQPCDMPAIAEYASEFGIPVIEDAAHAIGSTYADGSPVGNCTYSTMTVFSFHPVKTITTGEGGAITTNDRAVYQKLLLFRNHGITKDPEILTHNLGPWYYEQQELGYNYRITDVQCALGLRQLEKLDVFKARRKEIIARYNKAFSNLPHVVIPFEAPGLDSCFHLYVLQLDFEALCLDRAAVMNFLKGKGIGSQVLYIPVYTQPWYKKTYGYDWGLCPNAEIYYKKALSIPLFPKMDDEDVTSVIEAVQEVCS